MAKRTQLLYTLRELLTYFFFFTAFLPNSPQPNCTKVLSPPIFLPPLTFLLPINIQLLTTCGPGPVYNEH